MIFLLGAHAFFSALVFSIAYSFAGSGVALAALVGCAVSFANSAGLAIAWPRILAKKQVALAVGVIVFKFAILAWIIYLVVSSNRFDLRWFALGIATVVPSVVTAALLYSRATRVESES